MVLHSKHTVADALDDDVYASVDLSVSMPKYKFPETEIEAQHAYSVVHDELMLDGNSRQNLATFCQTWVEPAGTTDSLQTEARRRGQKCMHAPGRTLLGAAA
jgi:glutamate/tyrosine decarboxylase-like PLP-dependent enzyme